MDAVQRGERAHIFPFTENSDAMFNSALVHELSVLRPQAEPLLLQVRPDTRDTGGQPAALVPAVVPPGRPRRRARQLHPARVHRRVDAREFQDVVINVANHRDTEVTEDARSVA